MTEHTENELEKLIKERIAAKGRITFAEYMAACLYEPGLGYYTSPGRKVGAEGDFYTSSNVHQAFGRVIAKELAQMWQCLGMPDAFDLVEAGAGGGQLALDIMDTLAEVAPEFYPKVTYRFIEKEPSLRDAQAAKLAGHEGKLAWSTPDDLLSGNISVIGCILSNELIDSFPVHLVEQTGGGLKEVYVVTVAGELGEQVDELSNPAIAACLERVGATLVAGQRAEVNLAAPAWITAAASCLKKGFILTIDYGFPAKVLYRPGRMNGTLLCYYRHTLEENPYLNPGLQDITTHVDFTTLMQAGEAAGVATVWFGEQYRFLMGGGIIQELIELEARAVGDEEKIRHRLALKKLMLPEGGMGDTFQVLVQSKGVDNPQLRCMRDWSGLL
ncbi:SAM-dependent methyltransferase [Geobacter pelophilus]|uniref:SAM-dependent methyltransferase n=1 Tax=Geoanaerobacter pelophilus TaxID=60036 RepID=A0AAW4LBY4_9BACT|nr:SAM-dependent methyltransferase [Geoanaerobacter pelophilus]MBT0665377.1 SAM-dependent methyltransferase [Geoanaerobacter pelophilus]